MKNKNKEIIRIENILNGDMEKPCDNFIELLNVDLNNFLGEYFNLILFPNVNIIKIDGKFKVEISFIADTIKNFCKY